MLTPTANAAAGVDTRPTDRAGLAGDFDGFLRLLTAQLEHQDPLSPLDSEAFTSQLVQFATVEQAIRTNEGLDRLAGLVQADRLAAAAGYLGTEVEAAGNAVRLGPGDGPVALGYRLAGAAAGVEVTVTDPAERTVHRRAAGAADAGTHRFTWDGRDAAGRRAPEGLYRIDVAATGADGEPVAVETTVRGTVDGVEIDADGGMALSVDGVVVPLGAVAALRRGPAADG